MVKFSILINGSPKDFFRSSRGLRLDGAVLAGHISGFTVGPRSHTSLMVTHLLFADNTLIFCDALPTQIGKLRDILASFEAVSGLHINLAKSELVPVGDVLNMGELVAI